MPIICDALFDPTELVAFPLLPRPLRLQLGHIGQSVRWQHVVEGYRHVFHSVGLSANSLYERADGLWHVVASFQNDLIELGSVRHCHGTTLPLSVVVAYAGMHLEPSGLMF